MRILITGGAGFVGSHLVDAYLAAGHEVAVVDDLSTGFRHNLDPRAHFWQLDIRSADLARVLGEFRPEVVSHHAAQMSVAASVAEPRRDAEVNILGTLQLLEGAVRHGVRQVIFASTGGAMYGSEVAVPTPESAVARPVSPYGVSKLAAERYLTAFRFMHGLRSVALRYANVYGPRQSPHGEAGVVAIFCGRILAGQPLAVHGDGAQTRDYVHVADVVRANLLATWPEGPEADEVLNVGTGIETSVLDLIRSLEQIGGGRLERRHGPGRPGEQRRSALDSARALQQLGWRPTLDLGSGLQQTFAWFRQAAG
jgi:UDP-glucose 4-epimerase